MKPIILRTAVLTILAVLGLIAIAQAQRSGESAAPAASPVSAAASAGQGVPVVDSGAADAASAAPAAARPQINPFSIAPRGAVPAAAAQPGAGTASGPLPVSAPATAQPSAAAFSVAAAPASGVSKSEPRAEPVPTAAPNPAVMETTSRAAPSAAATAGSPPVGAEVGDRYRRAPAPAAEPATLPTDSAAPMQRLGRQSTSEAPASAAASREGQAQPGKKQLDGPQAPHLIIQKFAPPEVQVGKPATFKVSVANSGQVAAHGVEVRDLLPRGTQLLATKPTASRGAGGEVVWDLGTLKPGDEVSVEMQVMPVAEGEIGSVATVRFNADASARTTSTRPQLQVKVAAAPKVMIGDELMLTITVSNPGTGVATGVVLEERIPPGLQHPAGAELAYEIGALRPGESRQLQLPLAAVRPGPITNVLIAKGEGSLKVEERTQLEVVAPQLDVAMEGPKRRYLEREATYTVSVSNPGTASARQVELVAYLPRGLKFVSANNAGHYEAATQTVHWLLEELPARDSDKVELVTLPIEPGPQKLRLAGKAEKGLTVEREQPVIVEGIAAVLFEVSDVKDPIEVGGETLYEIRVVNQGSKEANNVRITVLVPPGMKAVAAEGPARSTLAANQVQFESLAKLAPKAETAYRVRVQGLQAGDQRVRVQLLTDEMQPNEPVTKEESTRVYRDE